MLEYYYTTMLRIIAAILIADQMHFHFVNGQSIRRPSNSDNKNEMNGHDRLLYENYGDNYEGHLSSGNRNQGGVNNPDNNGFESNKGNMGSGFGNRPNYGFQEGKTGSGNPSKDDMTYGDTTEGDSNYDYEYPNMDGIGDKTSDDFQDTTRDGFRDTTSNDFQDTTSDGFRDTTSNDFQDTTSDGFKATTSGGFQDTTSDGFQKTMNYDFQDVTSEVFRDKMSDSFSDTSSGGVGDRGSDGFQTSTGYGFQNTTTERFPDTTINGIQDGTSETTNTGFGDESSATTGQRTPTIQETSTHIDYPEPHTLVDSGSTYKNTDNDATFSGMAKSCTTHGHLCPSNSTCNERYDVMFCECNVGLTGSKCLETHPCLQDIWIPCTQDRVSRVCHGTCGDKMCFMDTCTGCFSRLDGKMV